MWKCDPKNENFHESCKAISSGTLFLFLDKWLSLCGLDEGHSLKYVTKKLFGSKSSIVLAWPILVVGTRSRLWMKRIKSSYEKKIQS